MTRPSESSVVPIRLILDGRSGVTLWATPWAEDDEEWQAFLGTGRRVLLFGTAAQLAEYLRTGEENDLSDHPQWPAVCRLPGRQLQPEPGYEFDLDGVYDLAAGDPDPFAVSELSDLLDIVQRIAECCDDGTLLRVLEETPEFAELLNDNVSFAGGEGEQRWSALGEALDRCWEGVLDRFGDLLDWRGETPVGVAGEDGEQPGRSVTAQAGADRDREASASAPGAEPATALAPAGDLGGEKDGKDGEQALGEDEAHEDEAHEDEGDEEIDGSVWDAAGILPIELAVPAGKGYTLRTYVEDEPRFLGKDLTVDIFATIEGLVAFCQGEDDHDLADLETWPLIRDAEELPVDVPEDEQYELSAPDPEAIDLARDLAEYCQLVGVEEALAGRGVEVGVPFDVWVAAVAEISTCLRWHE
jgi:hypothetical protein